MDNGKSYLKAILKDLKHGIKEDINEKKATYNLLRYLSSDDCNIQKLCRICFTLDKDMAPLLSTKENDLADMFTSLTSIQIYPDEGLPLQICLSCKNKVVNCYKFKEKCKKSNYTLRSVLKGEFITKVESCDDENTLSNIITSEENTVKSEINDEEEIHEDIEYLEDISDVASDHDTIPILQTTRKNKDRRKKEEINITITDSKTLFDEVISDKKLNGKLQKLYACKFCPKKYLKAKTLKSHIQQTHATALYPHSCGQCKESFTSEHDLRLHTALHSKDNVWICNHCHKEFKARQMLRRHIQRHMDLKRFSCETCGKPFVEVSALRRHLRVHTGDPIEKKHVCHICDKRYSSAALLATHAARHSGERPCACAACGKAFASARLLASHRRVHTDRKPYACLYCDKRFRHESTRNTHHRTHTGEKPYVCSVCGKTFIQNSNLTLHMRTHTGERPYSCTVCDRKFSSGSSLKAHRQTHTGEKPYSCNICGKRFARMDLSAHMRHHTGERPFACSVCPKKFVTAARLREHCRIHTGEKPFECALCTQKFTTKSHLVKHVKTHQTKNNKIENSKVVIVQQVDCDQSPIIAEKFVCSVNREDNENIKSVESIVTTDVTITDNSNKDADVVDDPLEVTEELVLDDNDVKTEVLVVDDNENDMRNCQSDNICLSNNSVNFINNDLNYANDVNLVTVNEGEVSISASSAMLEGTTVKLYQLDQSLVQISSSGGQVTISKITSKMTANF